MNAMRQRMVRGELYLAAEADLFSNHAQAQELVDRYNGTTNAQRDQRYELLQQLLGSVGETVEISRCTCDFGRPITVGANTFLNYGCVLLDYAPIAIGSSCTLGPGVQLLTADHPIDPHARRLGWEYAAPIRIGDNVLLGGGVIVCPGITIGNHTVVGAGAIVTRDLPAGIVAAGNPARVQRTSTLAITQTARAVTPFISGSAGRLASDITQDVARCAHRYRYPFVDLNRCVQ